MTESQRKDIRFWAIRYTASSMIVSINVAVTLFQINNDTNLINKYTNNGIIKLLVIRTLYERILRETEQTNPDLKYINVINSQINCLLKQVNNLPNMN